MIFPETRETPSTKLVARPMRFRGPSLLLAILLLVGCGYESHGAAGFVLTDGATPTLDAGANASPTSSGPGGDDGRPTFLRHDVAAVHAAVTAWRERYLILADVSSPDQPACIEGFAELEVATVTSEEFRRLCMRCEADDPDPECDDLGRANACAPIGRLRGPGGELGEGRMLILIAASYAPETPVYENLVIHETIHHLGRCTGDGIDHHHTRTPYWCSGGDVCSPEEAAQSINSRARVLLSNDR